MAVMHKHILPLVMWVTSCVACRWFSWPSLIPRPLDGWWCLPRYCPRRAGWFDPDEVVGRTLGHLASYTDKRTEKFKIGTCAMSLLSGDQCDHILRYHGLPVSLSVDEISIYMYMYMYTYMYMYIVHVFLSIGYKIMRKCSSVKQSTGNTQPKTMSTGKRLK